MDGPAPRISHSTNLGWGSRICFLSAQVTLMLMTQASHFEGPHDSTLLSEKSKLQQSGGSMIQCLCVPYICAEKNPQG